MKVAIVDEGIDKRELLYPQRLKKTIFVDEEVSEYGALQGRHGTICARLLEQCADDYDLLDVRITENWGTPVSVRTLKKALECCIREKADVICLSLGTVYLSDAVVLAPIMDEIRKKKILVVSSLSNSGRMTLPGAYPEVVCAVMDWNDMLEQGKCCSAFHDILKEIYVANIKIGPNVQGIWMGNSYAVPVVAGNMIKVMKNHEKDEADKWMDNRKLSFADLKKESWGQPLESPVAAVINKSYFLTPKLLLDTFAEEFHLEAAALVEKDDGDHFQIFGRNHSNDSRKVLLEKMDSYLEVSLLLSFYEEEEMKKEDYPYDIEVYCGEKEIVFYIEEKIACTLPASLGVETDICRTLISLLS